ncbi:unnamed protein product [Symbiodinium sp. KB8]|nr:unnamed protein product [Symbiodinium sp. KB8]
MPQPVPERSPRTDPLLLRLAAAFGGLAVAIGAFAAHVLRDRLADQALATLETGVRYQMYHALALGLCAVLAGSAPRARVAGYCFTAGILLFSGSLYGLAILEARWLGPVTPVGGVAFLAGWVLLGLARPRSPAP